MVRLTLILFTNTTTLLLPPSMETIDIAAACEDYDGSYCDCASSCNGVMVGTPIWYYNYKNKFHIMQGSNNNTCLSYHHITYTVARLHVLCNNTMFKIVLIGSTETSTLSCGFKRKHKNTARTRTSWVFFYSISFPPFNPLQLVNHPEHQEKATTHPQQTTPTKTYEIIFEYSIWQRQNTNHILLFFFPNFVFFSLSAIKTSQKS